MAIQNQPSRIPEPFAESGTKNVIPATNATPSASQAASWASGFPPECSRPLSAGGCPVPRDDMNGIFNTITRSERFTQEGGIWAWDATVDYAANRLVLGSDGLLYWSVAQSGPNVGGAQDPTTDDGTYWGGVPMTAPGLGDKSDKAATTEWVKDLAVAAVYVDAASGSDSNGGFSSSEPVKTIGKGIDILSKLPTVQGSFVRLYINAGTYDEDILLEKAKYDISISGNIYINGSIRFSNCFCKITQPAGNSLNISCSNILFAIYCDNGSNVDISTDINITCNNVNDVVFVGRHSHFNCSGGISISGSAITNGVSLYEYGSAVIQQIQESNGVVNCGLNIKSNSFLFVKGNATLYGLSTIFCDNFSFIIIDCDSVSVNNIGANGDAILATNFSFINIVAKTMSISLGGTNVTSAIKAMNFSFISTKMSQSYTFSGACVITVSARAFGFVLFGPASATVSGSVTGQRYYTNDHGLIYTYGAGANRIPGTVAGEANAGAFGMYY